MNKLSKYTDENYHRTNKFPTLQSFGYNYVVKRLDYMIKRKKYFK